eukprot:TRINITY_DN63385_c0_g1_i4.p2 TRINITY_DN63385_c0_g1~~TRINITY_DN63385_c0_g1_i4.p2  ORF type:complete len:276 (+),score=30.36 TRINITY_DN63385_c0_g1_i4:105-932(+)
MNLTPADKKRFKQHMDAKYLPQYVHSIPAPPDICEAVENLLKPRVLDLLPLSDSQKTSDNDMLARMLISTDFDLDETEAKLRRYLKWREQDRIDGIFQETIPPDILHPLTGGFCGHDNEGHPMYYGYWPPTHILMPLLKKYTVMDLLRSHFLLMERQREACIVDNQPQVSVVTDFSKAGLGILYHWGAVKAIKEMMLYDDKYYPEHMRHCFLVGKHKNSRSGSHWTRSQLNGAVQAHSLHALMTLPTKLEFTHHKDNLLGKMALHPRNNWMLNRQ